MHPTLSLSCLSLHARIYKMGSDNEMNDFRVNRCTYPIIYSKADLSKFPSRENFGEVVVEGFNYGPGKVKVEYWACCLEQHENTSGQHCHVSVKLSGPKRWNPVKTYLAERYGICVHFSESSATYYAAFKYISKTDKNVYETPNHPDLKEVGSPKTKKMHKRLQREVSKEQTHQQMKKNFSKLKG